MRISPILSLLLVQSRVVASTALTLVFYDLQEMNAASLEAKAAHWAGRHLVVVSYDAERHGSVPLFLLSGALPRLS